MGEAGERGLFRFSLDIEGEKRLPGREIFALLNGIRAYGSIRRASEEAGLSYRHAWGLLRSAEETLGMQLVQKHTGGPAGGGTELTPGGARLLSRYSQLQKELERQWEGLLSAAQPEEEPEAGRAAGPSRGSLLLATTMEPVESGLLDLLEQAFFRYSGILVRHVALGSGRALEVARQGRVDLALTHVPSLEREFMADGFGWWRLPLLANDMVLVGPHSDPAGAGAVDPGEGLAGALARVARSQCQFISRQDQSGTHLRERELWQAAGIEPGGEWYRSGGGPMGNLGVLELARELQGYALVDMAAFRLQGGEGGLRILVSLDKGNARREEASNLYSLLAVNPLLVPHASSESLETLREWLQEEGRELISGFGRERFGKPLFSLP